MNEIQKLLSELLPQKLVAPPPKKETWTEEGIYLVLIHNKCKICKEIYVSPAHVPFRKQTHPLLGLHMAPIPNFNPSIGAFSERFVHNVLQEIACCHHCYLGTSEPNRPVQLSLEFHHELH
jgi:hypothetical protein